MRYCFDNIALHADKKQCSIQRDHAYNLFALHGVGSPMYLEWLNKSDSVDRKEAREWRQIYKVCGDHEYGSVTRRLRAYHHTNRPSRCSNFS